MQEEKKKSTNLALACRSEMSGMHICSIYKEKSELMQTLLPYLVCGLKNNKKCLYIKSEMTKSEICDGLQACGIDPDIYVQSEQLVFMDKTETYLKDGFFAPFRMLDYLEYAHYDTLKNGYRGLRVAGEAHWALDNPPGAERLIDYESQVNNTLYRKRASALCLYDETIFPEDLLLRMLYTHPKVAIYGELYNNSFYISPERFDQDGKYKYRAGYYPELRDKIIAGTA